MVGALPLLVGLLVADPGGAGAARDAVLLLQLKPIGVSVEEASVVDGLIASEIDAALSRLPARDRPLLHTADELQTLTSIESQRALAGCEGTESCLAELAGAVGARYVVTGTLGRLGDDVVLQLSLVDTQTATTLARGNATRRGASELAATLQNVVDAALRPLLDGARPSAATPSSSGGVPWGAVGFGALGVVGAGAAVVGFAGLAALDGRLAPNSGASTVDKQQALDLAWPALVTGVVGVVVAVGGGVGAALALAPE